MASRYVRKPDIDVGLERALGFGGTIGMSLFDDCFDGIANLRIMIAP